MTRLNYALAVGLFMGASVGLYFRTAPLTTSYSRDLQALPRLEDFTGSPPAFRFPLQECQGDCDTDFDCDIGLRCFQREIGDPVPGCDNGGLQVNSVSDFCISVLASQPDYEDGSPPGDNVDMMPQEDADGRPIAQWVGNDGYPRKSYPLQICQADCDYEYECDWGLYCHRRSDARDPIPGCSYDPETMGDDIGGSDFCVPKPTILDGAFRLRLYWEEGYEWQDVTEEVFYCMTTKFDGWPGTGNCWYSDWTQPCQDDQVYITLCDGEGLDDEQQAFRFLPVPKELYDTLDDDDYNATVFTEEIMIQVADASDQRCFQRTKREIHLRECDHTIKEQRWWANNGTSFDDISFEISQIDYEKQCLTNDHHPKPGEVIETHGCKFSRSEESQTSKWMRW